MTPVTICIKTIHDYGGETEQAVVRYDGKRYEKDGKTVLRYEEVLYEGAAPVMTTLTVDDREVKLHRKGSIGGDMLFRAGETCEFFYRTGYGNLPMEIRTQMLMTERMPGADLVRIGYELYAEGKKTGKINIEITVNGCEP